MSGRRRRLRRLALIDRQFEVIDDLRPARPLALGERREFGRHGITVNCIHPGTTRTERTPTLLAARAKQLGVSPEEAERRDFAPDSPRGNSICRMVDASEIAFVTAFLASDKAWAVSGELIAATGGAGRTVYY